MDGVQNTPSDSCCGLTQIFQTNLIEVAKIREMTHVIKKFEAMEAIIKVTHVLQVFREMDGTGHDVHEEDLLQEKSLDNPKKHRFNKSVNRKVLEMR